MKATLALHEKFFLGDFIIEIVVWALPEKTAERPHSYKYRLFCGNKLGKCIVRYDNEKGKGDHKHIFEQEFPYQFINTRQLIKDFMSDVELLSKQAGDKNER